jgi:naringenin degradation protein FdeE
VRVTVVERAEQWAGAAIAYYHRAVYALDELGILGQILERGNATAPDAPSWWSGIYNAHGEQMGFRSPVLSEGWTLPSAVSLYRPILCEIMTKAATEQEAELLIGHTYRSVRPREDRVEVELTTGASRSFDLLVAADGVNSQIRAGFFGEVGEPNYIGSMAFRMMFKHAPEFWRTGLHVAKGTTISTNMLPGRHFYLALPHKMQCRHVDQEEAREIVRAELAKYRPSEMFDSIAEHLTDDVHIIVAPYEWIYVPPPWHRGRIVLLGDAVHATAPTIGSAGGMAIEDGVVLAQELAKTDDVDAALHAYAGRRGERARLVVEASETLMKTHQERRPAEEEAEIRLAALQELIEPY